MQVLVYATLRDLLGVSSVTLDLTTPTALREVLVRLEQLYPALAEKMWQPDGSLSDYMKVILNGRPVQYLDGLATIVRDDDRLHLFPPVAGG